MTDLSKLEGVIWMDGELVEWRSASVHALTHTLHYGYGAFEGVRAYDTEKGPAIFRLACHTKRLLRSAKSMRLAIPFDENTLNEAQKLVVRENKLNAAYIRPLVYLGTDTISLDIRDAGVKVLIAAWPWGAYLGEEKLQQGIRAKTASLARHHPASSMSKIKACGNYMNSIFALREVTAAGYDEAIMMDIEGFVAEGSGENIFLVINGKLVTPTNAHCLEGITRATVMELAQDQGIEVVERRISRDELYSADEAFFTGTAAEVTPIREVDDRPVGDGYVGEITAKMQRSFFDAVSGRSKEYDGWLAYCSS